LHTTQWNLEALDLFYRGLSHFYAGTRSDNAAAREIFETLTHLKPDSTIGPAYLCFTYWVDAFRGWANSRDQSVSEAVRLAEQALRLDPANNGLPYLVLAFVDLLHHRHDEALVKCNEALKLRPNCPTANSYLANILHYCGRSAEAIARIREAMRITPVFPTWYLTLLAAAYRDSGDLQKSLTAAQHAARLSPDDLDARLVLCSAYIRAGQVEQAHSTAREILAIDPVFSITRYAESQPYRDRAALKRLVDNLKQAGLPES
jgi:tetratricopeptide (TPR) repeat protein